MSIRLRESMVDELKARAAASGITVDQYVTAALVAALPVILGEVFLRSCRAHADAARWPEQTQQDTT